MRGERISPDLTTSEEMRGFRIGGIDSPEARETLADRLDQQRVSGIQMLLTDCEGPPLWREDTDLPDFDRELAGGASMVWAEVCMSPLTFLRLQAGANEARGFDLTADAFLSRPAEATRTREFIELVGEQVLPHPLIELDREGRLVGFQEGRKRAIAAFYAGADSMPVYVFLNTETTKGAPDLSPPSEFNLRAVLESHAPET